jgi:hypothetical protein
MNASSCKRRTAYDVRYSVPGVCPLLTGAAGVVFGQLDRITGDVEAAIEHWSHEANPAKLRSATLYSLKCKPTQRMF